MGLDEVSQEKGTIFPKEQSTLLLSRKSSVHFSPTHSSSSTALENNKGREATLSILGR